MIKQTQVVSIIIYHLPLFPLCSFPASDITLLFNHSFFCPFVLLHLSLSNRAFNGRTKLPKHHNASAFSDSLCPPSFPITPSVRSFVLSLLSLCCFYPSSPLNDYFYCCPPCFFSACNHYLPFLIPSSLIPLSLQGKHPVARMMYPSNSDIPPIQHQDEPKLIFG